MKKNKKQKCMEKNCGSRSIKEKNTESNKSSEKSCS